MSSRMLGSVVLGLCCSLLAGQEPKPDLSKKPQWQRLLTGEDAKNAEKLAKRIADCEEIEDYEGAIESAQELLVLRSRIQGSEHWEVISDKFQIIRLKKFSAASAEKVKSWRNAKKELALTYAMETAGQFEKAIAIKKQYADLSRELLGEDHPVTAGSYDRLAYNFLASGKINEASTYFQKCLESLRRTLGEIHPDTALGYAGMALFLQSTGQSLKAQPLFEKSLGICKSVFGDKHTETATLYNSIANNLNTLGKPFEAHPFYQKALEIRRSISGENHFLTAQSYHNLARNLQTLGRSAEAQALLQKALDINRRIYGDQHVHTATCYNSMAVNLQDLGKWEESRILSDKAIEIRRKIFGENHRETANSYQVMGMNLQSQGKLREAQLFLYKSLEILRRILGDSHPETALCYLSVASNFEQQGNFVDAQMLQRKSLDIWQKAFGEYHPLTARAYGAVANNYHEQSKWVEAKPLLDKSLEISRKVFGEMHPQTASSYLNLASNLDIQGKSNEASLLFQKAIAINMQFRGKHHPGNINMYVDHASNLRRLNKIAEMQIVLSDAIVCYESYRISGAHGIERAALDQFNPRLLLASQLISRQPSTAWEQVERTLARGMLDQEATKKSSLDSKESQQVSELNYRLSEYQEKILALAGKTTKSTQETTQLAGILRQQEEVEEQLASMAASFSTREVAERLEIQSAIAADSALLFWIEVNDKSGQFNENWACVVRSKGDPRWERLLGTGPDSTWTIDDTKLASRFRSALTNSAPTMEVKSLARQLHAQRITPILRHLEGVKTLHVIGVNGMAGIPIEALTNDYVVHYVPSGSYLARLRGRPKITGQDILVLGDPVFLAGDKKPVIAAKPLPPGGLLVLHVTPDSTAANADIRAGDVLLKYGDKSIDSFDSLIKAASEYSKAENIALTIWRESSVKPITKQIPPGRMGLVFNPEPAPVAITNRRKFDEQLARLRGGEWSDLPGTRIETNRLQQLFGPNARVLTDSEASEQTLERLRKSGELEKYRYLHFATHGEGNSVQAFESALILSQDQLPKEMLPRPGEPFINGQLSAREVLDFWKLNAELVTLSACETAIGKPGSGDGLLGFAQAFLTAGARSVCLSLWKVDDTATALLMSRFYENLLGKREGLTKPMGKAAALDEARRWLRELSADEALTLSAKLSNGVARGNRGKGVSLKTIPGDDPKSPTAKSSKPFAHPKYWAAFILIGDPN